MAIAARSGGLQRFALRVVLLIAAGLLTRPVDATELPAQRSVPGGVALVDLGASPEPPRASFDATPVMIIGGPSRWTAVIGIGLDAEPGKHHLDVRRPGVPVER